MVGGDDHILIAAALSTPTAHQAFFHTGLNNDLPLAVAVVLSHDLAFGSAAAQAGLGGYTVGILPIMTQSRNGLGLKVATIAGMLLLTLLGAGGLYSHKPFAKGMTIGIHIVINIALAAVAGIGGVTLLGAGRSGHNRFIGVAQLFQSSGLGSATAADHDVIAIFGAGGLHALGFSSIHVSAGSGDFNGLTAQLVAADRAGNNLLIGTGHSAGGLHTVFLGNHFAYGKHRCNKR